MSRSVPRAGRVLDVVGALVFLAGAATYVRAWIGLRGMEDFERAPDAPAFAALARSDELSALSSIGAGLMVAGVATAVIASVVARRVRTRREDGTDPAA